MTAIASPLARMQSALTDLNPVTGPERLPPGESGSALPWILLGSLIVVGVAALAWHRRRTAAPTATEIDWNGELDQLLSAPFDGRQFAERLSQLLRRRLGSQFDVPAETLTTSELAARWPGDMLRRDAWLQLLGRCDLARYAHEPLTREESAQAVRTAQTLLAEDLIVTKTLPPKKFGEFRQNTSSTPDSAADGKSAGQRAPSAG